MLKYVLLATAMVVASPALAQETVTPDTSAQDQQPVTEPTSPAQVSPQPAEAPSPAMPAPVAPMAETVLPTQPAAPIAQTMPAAQPAPAPQPVTTEAQIGQLVNAEFATYDKDGNGALDRAEFDAWVGTLQKAAHPEFDAASPTGAGWLTAAFAQADTDKNASITAAEMTSFLTPKPA